MWTCNTFDTLWDNEIISNIFYYNHKDLHLTDLFYQSYVHVWIKLIAILHVTESNELNTLNLIVSEDLIQINFINIWIVIVNYVLFIFLFIFLFILFFKLFLIKFLENNFFIIFDQLYIEYEHNVGNGEDLIFILVSIFAFFFIIFFYIFNIIFFMEFYLFYCYLLVTFILIPLKIFWSFGAFFINYIRGSSSFMFYLKDYLYDLMMLTVYLTRFFVQMVRILVMYIMYFSLHEYIFIIPKNFLINASENFLIFNSNSVTHILDFIRFLLEFLDTCITLTNQILSLTFVIFWLFSYINTFELKQKIIFWFNKK